jgi:hypothetical protein
VSGTVVARGSVHEIVGVVGMSVWMMSRRSSGSPRSGYELLNDQLLEYEGLQAYLQVASKKKAAPHKRCQHLQSCGLTWTAERALLLAISDDPEHVPRAVEWTKVFPDPRLAKAVVDRITHKAHIIDTGTERWRCRHGLRRQGRKRA